MRAHWPALLAADFFTTEVWTGGGLMTYYTVFVIELHSRRVHVLGSTRHPDEAFVAQVSGAHGRRGCPSFWSLLDVRPRSEVERCDGDATQDGRRSSRAHAGGSAELQRACGADSEAE
jgi:hypothetical protein